MSSGLWVSPLTEMDLGGTEPMLTKKINACFKEEVSEVLPSSKYCLFLRAARPTLPNLANKLVDAHPALPRSLAASPGVQEPFSRILIAVSRMVLMQSSLGRKVAIPVVETASRLE